MKPGWPSRSGKRAKLRDRDKTYNVVSFAELQQNYPGFDWSAWLAANQMPKPDRVNVVTPDAVQPVLDVVDATPLPTWQDYLRFHAIDGNADLLSRQIDEASFEFNGKVLSGQKAQRDDWKRAVALVGSGGGLAMRWASCTWRAISSRKPNRRWTSWWKTCAPRCARTSRRSTGWARRPRPRPKLQKLSTFRPKIGYPSKWKDYSSVSISPRTCWQCDRAAQVQPRRREPPHRPEDRPRGMGHDPQTVNAYYNASFNEIVFPAAILQPPFFDVNADAAVNYGAIGAVIGHEMGHGFDDQGSKSDADGIQRNWWTDEDRARFEQRTKALGAVRQLLPAGRPVRERRADHGREPGRPGRHFDGLHRLPAEPEGQARAGDRRPQRRPAFLPGLGAGVEGSYRDESLLTLIKTNPHSPVMYRANGPLRNFDPRYKAFEVKAGEKMYLAPEQRVRIW